MSYMLMAHSRAGVPSYLVWEEYGSLVEAMLAAETVIRTHPRMEVVRIYRCDPDGDCTPGRYLRVAKSWSKAGGWGAVGGVHEDGSEQAAGR